MLSVYVFNPFFFFFKAEDGIRDVAVTGVQTCALPICQALQLGHERRIAARPPRRVAQGRARHPQQRTRPPAREPAGHRVAHLGATDRYALHFFALISFSTSSSSSRSASSPFKRAFSRSRRLSRMASVSVRPPYFLRHR